MVVPKTRRRSANDIELDGIGMMLESVIDIRPDPGAEPPPDAVYSDFSAGMGYSEYFVPDTYGWCDGSESSDDPDGPWPGGDCRSGVFMPAGAIHKLNILTPPNTTYAYRSSVNFQGNLFFFGDNQVVAVSGGDSPNGSFTKDLGAGVATGINAATVFNGQIVVGLDGAGLNSICTTSDGVTWPVSALGFPIIKVITVYWDSGGVGALRLIGQTSNNSIRTCTGDPTVGANWSAPIVITAMAQGGITSMAASAKHLYLCGPDGIFDLDARGHAANLTPDFAQNYIIGNGGASIIHDGDLHVNVGNGIRRIPLGGARVDEPEQYQPGANIADGSPIWGYASLPSRDNGWLIWPIWNPALNKTYILMAKDKRLLGKDVPGPMVWQGAIATYAGIVTHTRVHSPNGGETRLWCCTESSPMKIYWQTLPFSGNPYQEYIHGAGTTHQWGTHTSMYVGPRWERPATKVIPLGYNLETENTDSGSRVSVFRRNDKEVDSDGDPVWTRKAVAQNSSYVSVRDMGDESFSRIDGRIDLDGTTDSPAIMRSFRWEADVNVVQRVWRKYTAVLRWPQLTARSTKQRGSIKSVASAVRHLRSLEGVNATPVTFKDEDGDEARVRMIPSMIERKQKARNGKWEHVLTFVLETLNRRIKWNSGEHWNDTDSWGAA